MTKLEEARKQIELIDQEMARLFEKRMQAVQTVAQYKHENNLPVFDKAREEALIEKNVKYIKDAVLTEYYRQFLIETMEISKQYQTEILSSKKS